MCIRMCYTSTVSNTGTLEELFLVTINVSYAVFETVYAQTLVFMRLTFLTYQANLKILEAKSFFIEQIYERFKITVLRNFVIMYQMAYLTITNILIGNKE